MSGSRLIAVLAFTALLPTQLSAHPGHVTSANLWRAWSLEPFALVPIVLLAGFWLHGLRVLRQRRARAAVAADSTPPAAARPTIPLARERWRAAAFMLGVTTLLVALCSPLHALGGTLLSAHMAQHQLFMLLAAPLLVWSRPIPDILRALPYRALPYAAGAARRLHAFTRAVLLATAVHAAAIWVWHIPALYQATLSSELLHSLQHGSFIGTALWFWWAVLDRPAPGVPALALFLTSLHTTLLGALFTFSSAPWYPVYASGAFHWHLTPLQDQQLAGLIMWVPGSLVYAGAALWIIGRWLQTTHLRQERARALA
jgi:putative membrane protein